MRGQPRPLPPQPCPLRSLIPGPCPLHTFTNRGGGGRGALPQCSIEEPHPTSAATLKLPHHCDCPIPAPRATTCATTRLPSLCLKNKTISLVLLSKTFNVFCQKQAKFNPNFFDVFPHPLLGKKSFVLQHIVKNTFSPKMLLKPFN